MRKVLGKIKKARFGRQDGQFGVSFSFSFDSCGIGTGYYAWGIDTECSDSTKWTEADRDKEFAFIMRKVNQLMLDAKVQEFSSLTGVPVELELDGNRLNDWRILTEVL